MPVFHPSPRTVHFLWGQRDNLVFPKLFPPTIKEISLHDIIWAARGHSWFCIQCHSPGLKAASRALTAFQCCYFTLSHSSEWFLNFSIHFNVHFCRKIKVPSQHENLSCDTFHGWARILSWWRADGFLLSKMGDTKRK